MRAPAGRHGTCAPGGRRTAIAAGLLAALLAATACAPTGPRPAASSHTPSPSAHAERQRSSPAERVQAIVDRMDLRQRAAAVVMGNVPGTDPAQLKTAMSGGGGGVILMGSNVPGSPDGLHAMTSALTADPALPPLIATDEEGGDVVRLPWDDQPGADVLKSQPAAAVQTAFAARGRTLQAAGVTVNFGIVADVAQGPDSFIYDRSFGTDPSSAADRVAAAVRGEEPFVRSTLKHFPGHGAAEGDSHHGIPSTGMDLATWRAQVAPPFLAGIRAGAPVVMMGHLAYTAVDPEPASLSPRWHEILRHDLGFRGVIVSDDLNMLTDSGVPAYADVVADAVRSVAAGSDLVLAIGGAGPDTAQKIADALVAAVQRGELPASRLEDAVSHVVALRLQSAPAR